jgi:hypothetical protein
MYWWLDTVMILSALGGKYPGSNPIWVQVFVWKAKEYTQMCT